MIVRGLSLSHQAIHVSKPKEGNIMLLHYGQMTTIKSKNFTFEGFSWLAIWFEATRSAPKGCDLK